MQFNYEIDYKKLNPWKDICTGLYVAKGQAPGLHACEHEMQGATTAGLVSLVLPPQMRDGLREPNVTSPYLSQRDASKTQNCYSHYAQSYGSISNIEKWDPCDGSHFTNMMDF